MRSLAPARRQASARNSSSNTWASTGGLVDCSRKHLLASHALSQLNVQFAVRKSLQHAGGQRDTQPLRDPAGQTGICRSGQQNHVRAPSRGARPPSPEFLLRRAGSCTRAVRTVDRSLRPRFRRPVRTGATLDGAIERTRRTGAQTTPGTVFGREPVWVRRKIVIVPQRHVSTRRSRSG